MAGRCTCRHQQRVHSRLPASTAQLAELQLDAVQRPAAQLQPQGLPRLGGLLDAPAHAALHNVQLLRLHARARSAWGRTRKPHTKAGAAARRHNPGVCSLLWRLPPAQPVRAPWQQPAWPGLPRRRLGHGRCWPCWRRPGSAGVLAAPGAPGPACCAWPARHAVSLLLAVSDQPSWVSTACAAVRFATAEHCQARQNDCQTPERKLAACSRPAC